MNQFMKNNNFSAKVHALALICRKDKENFYSFRTTFLTARMCRLICAFVVRIWHKQVFLMMWLNFAFKML